MHREVNFAEFGIYRFPRRGGGTGHDRVVVKLKHLRTGGGRALLSGYQEAVGLSGGKHAGVHQATAFPGGRLREKPASGQVERPTASLDV